MQKCEAGYRLQQTGGLHDIGKNLVSIMLEGAGYEVLDLGMDVSLEKFVEAVRTDKEDALALSALLTTTMPNMISTIAALEQTGLRKQVKVMIGGAPITDNLKANLKRKENKRWSILGLPNRAEAR
jgi:methanogenic corrinoid protein MtbC1